MAADAKVVFDFTDASWGFPSDYVKTEQSYTNADSLTVVINAPEGHKYMTASKTDSTIIGIIFGKQGATLTLPAFDFAVGKIVVTGLSNASGKVTTNIFVGDAAVSTEITGSKEVNTFKIAEEKQAAGNVFVLKITNANNAQAAKIEIFEAGEEPAAPEVVIADTINVAKAIELGMKLDSMATDSVVYAVEGYVINAGSFSLLYHNQSWYMADSATATASDFQAYNCFPIEGNDTLKVLNGDKVQIIGKLKKFYNKSAAKYIIEIEKANATFISKVEGDHTVVVTTEEVTVAQALTIGAGLADNASTEKQYKITGYVSAEDVAYSDQYKNQSFWVADDATSTAASNADGAFYVYRGKPENEEALAVGTKVEFTCTIKKYVGSNGAVIENADQNIIIKVLEAPVVELDTINVAQAVDLALALDNNAVSAKKYAIVGYVAKIKTEYSSQYKNISFYMTDDATQTYGDLQVYRGAISEADGTTLAAGDRVTVVGKLKNNFYNDANSAQTDAGAEVTVDWKAAIENITLTEEVNKVIVDGVLYIVRDGKIYNVQGVQVR